MASCKKEVFLPSTEISSETNEVFHTRSGKSPELQNDLGDGDETSGSSSVTVNDVNIDFNDNNGIVDPKDPSAKPSPNKPRGTK